jgi:hypothetical protein
MHSGLFVRAFHRWRCCNVSGLLSATLHSLQAGFVEAPDASEAIDKQAAKAR